MRKTAKSSYQEFVSRYPGRKGFNKLGCHETADNGEGEKWEEGTRPETLRNTTPNEMRAWAIMLVSKSWQHMEVHDTANGRHVLKRKNIRRHIGAVR